MSPTFFAIWVAALALVIVFIFLQSRALFFGREYEDPVLAAVSSGSLRNASLSKESFFSPTRSLQACSGLLALHLNSDIKDCVDKHMAPFVVNAFCREPVCDDFVQNSSAYAGKRHPIVILTCDTGSSDPAHAMWKRYAKEHAYTYLPLRVQATLVPARTDLQCISAILRALDDASVSHVDLFVYAGLDRWVVKPHAILEPLFERTGLLEGEKVMAVVDKFPCKNFRPGGDFDMGNFLLRRSPALLDILKLLQMMLERNRFSTGIANTFSVQVYPDKKSQIAVMESGCPLGSPFGAIVGQMSLSLSSIFDAKAGRGLLPILRECMLRRFETGDARPCSLYPPWVGGQCLWCPRSMAVRSSGGETVTLNYDTCCGEDDSTLAVEMLEEDAVMLASSDFTRGERQIHLGLLYADGPPVCPGFWTQCTSFGGHLGDHPHDDLRPPFPSGMDECEVACELDPRCGSIALVCAANDDTTDSRLCYLKSKGSVSNGYNPRVCFKTAKLPETPA
mmetsp:Transcript_42950/g.138066  ORF Transcript_42950/g.138066 Transcript_42950/m.138066 type:complete len:507 (-) Transcript_42950:101-1621(-)|eukprot:CAMPEP_0203844732 /NCGR_PEP_ID=MMETSP0359-20131031/3384_1 /ASSEMBLY_ACC=CAM_ASM_000338 /TAXON_ID=268821 /ORGANISM="Scrippsiella Hangoei, Strain SHTV-5" /LENGTH=506 /DNA_ID=CAMNT_0050759737 /DNA_START=129 /DNA_END=1649 /DNA_ORIENTATION=-